METGGCRPQGQKQPVSIRGQGACTHCRSRGRPASGRPGGEAGGGQRRLCVHARRVRAQGTERGPRGRGTLIRWYRPGQCGGTAEALAWALQGPENLQSRPRPVRSVHSRALIGHVCSLRPVLCQFNRTITVRVECGSPRDGTSLTGLLGGRGFRVHIPAREPTRPWLRKELTETSETPLLP